MQRQAPIPPRGDDGDRDDRDGESRRLQQQSVGSPRFGQEGKSAEGHPRLQVLAVVRLDMLQVLPRVQAVVEGIQRPAQGPDSGLGPTPAP